MNIANITARFARLTGLDKSEAYEWKSLIDDAVEYIESIVKKTDISNSDKLRLETLCAVYAFRLYTLCSDDGVTSFTAGDVKVTSSADIHKRADSLWNEYRRRFSDLVESEEFLFGAVSV